MADQEICDEFIETFTGGRFWFGERMGGSDLRILDIAHALSIENRFGGHARVPYSVAEHCCHVHDLVDAGRGYVGWQSDRLAALLHDAHEAYTKDLMRPLRRQPELEAYNGLAKRVQDLIERRYGLAISESVRSLIKDCDTSQLRHEARELMPSRGENWSWPAWLWRGQPSQPNFRPLAYWSPAEAEAEFLKRFWACF